MRPEEGDVVGVYHSKTLAHKDCGYMWLWFVTVVLKPVSFQEHPIKYGGED